MEGLPRLIWPTDYFSSMLLEGPGQKWMHLEDQCMAAPMVLQVLASLLFQEGVLLGSDEIHLTKRQKCIFADRLINVVRMAIN